MFEIRESYREMIDVKMIKSIDQEEITQLRRQEYTPSKLYYDVDTVFQELYPNCCKFCEKKVEKSIESNNFGDSNKNCSWTAGFSDLQYEYFVDELKKNNLKMKMNL